MECFRRDFLIAGLGCGMASLLSAQEPPAASRPREGDLLVKAGDSGANPLSPADVRTGGKQIMAWAMDPADKTVRSGSRFNRILLIRLDPDKLSAETRSRAADGVVAYSAICTHAGCEVTDWLSPEQRLFCPCHESTFDPLDGAKVVDGPATRMLPALPLGLAEGRLVVAKPFTAPITIETQ